MKLSIIIPVYNADKYLSKCLDEILLCPIAAMECLVINDGSTDSSLHICETYAKRDSRIKIINKHNEGVSIARNTGIAHATGEYVMFLDADDYIETSKWVHIVEAIDRKIDFTAYSYFTLYQDGTTNEELFYIRGKETNDIHEMRKLLLGSAALNTCWGKIFKLDIIMSNGVRFKEGLKTGEDAIFVLEYLKFANTVLLNNESIIYYRQHEESVMHQLDIYSLFQDFELLFNYRKQASALWDSQEINEHMYREFFSVITNLLLRYAHKNKLSECRHVLKQLLGSYMTQEILSNVNQTHLRSFYKKVEYSLMKRDRIHMLSSYFKLKSNFL